MEDLKKSPHDSRLRNPLLAQAFYFAGWIERWGSGTIRILELCRLQGLPEPDFRSEKGRFEVIFYKDPYTEERLRQMGLNERQVKAVLRIKVEGSITNREFRELTGLSDEAARKDLAELTEKGLLRVEGKGRGTRYVLPKPGD